MLTKPYDVGRLIHLVREALNMGESDGAPSAEIWEERTEAPGHRANLHYVKNRLSGLMAGIRALRLELHAVADDASEVKRPRISIPIGCAR